MGTSYLFEECRTLCT